MASTIVLVLLIAWLYIAPVTGVYSHPDGELRFFQSEQELRDWVDDNQLPIVLIANSEGTISFLNPMHDPCYDCDDYALEMVVRAELDGYRMYECPVSRNGLVFGYTRVRSGDIDPHVGCWTRVEDTYYYIEPMPPTKIVKLCDID